MAEENNKSYFMIIAIIAIVAIVALVMLVGGRSASKGVSTVAYTSGDGNLGGQATSVRGLAVKDEGDNVFRDFLCSSDEDCQIGCTDASICYGTCHTEDTWSRCVYSNCCVSAD